MCAACGFDLFIMVRQNIQTNTFVIGQLTCLETFCFVQAVVQKWSEMNQDNRMGRVWIYGCKKISVLWISENLQSIWSIMWLSLTEFAQIGHEISPRIHVFGPQSIQRDEQEQRLALVALKAKNMKLNYIKMWKHNDEIQSTAEELFTCSNNRNSDYTGPFSIMN